MAVKERTKNTSLVAVYLAGAATAVILFNANIGAGEWALAIWGISSVLLGWGTGKPALALLAFLAIPFAIPFGIPDNYEFSEPLPIWWTVAVCSLFSAALILISAVVKLVVDAKKPRRSGASR